MGFLRRLFGGDERTTTDRPSGDAPASDADIQADEQAYERELLRAEHERLDDLRQRQLRYADHAWQPPAEGGSRRADDGDGDGEA